MGAFNLKKAGKASKLSGKYKWMGIALLFSRRLSKLWFKFWLLSRLTLTSLTAIKLLQATRPKTWPAAAAPILVGSALALNAGSLKPFAALLCFVFALLCQIASNLANDCFDGLRGADGPGRLGPIRFVGSGKLSPSTLYKAIYATLGAAFIIGLCLIPYGGWILLPIGLLCMGAALAYTAGPFPLAYKGLGDVFVILFFGLIAVSATFYVQTGALSGAALACGLAVGVLAANILCVNNVRDAPEDRANKKHTLVVQLGARFAYRQYALSVLFATALLPITLAAFTQLNWSALLPLLLLPWGLSLCTNLTRTRGRALNAHLAKTAVYLLVYAAVLAVGIAV